jgi:hypothetical protein
MLPAWPREGQASRRNLLNPALTSSDLVNPSKEPVLIHQSAEDHVTCGVEEGYLGNF